MKCFIAGFQAEHKNLFTLSFGEDFKEGIDVRQLCCLFILPWGAIWWHPSSINSFFKGGETLDLLDCYDEGRQL